MSANNMPDIFFIGNKESQTCCANYALTCGSGMFIESNKDQFKTYVVKGGDKKFLKKLDYPNFGPGFNTEKYKRIMGITLTPSYRRLIDYLFGGPGKNVLLFTSFVSVPEIVLTKAYDNSDEIIKTYKSFGPDCIVMDVPDNYASRRFLIEINSKKEALKNDAGKAIPIPKLQPIRIGEFCG